MGVSVHAIVRIWASLVLVFLVRTWSQARQLSKPKEVLLYAVAFVIAYVTDTFIWPTRTEMGREESDLVQEYLKHRKEGETIGQYLIRLEKEEEESIKLHEKMLFRKGRKQDKGQRKAG